MLQKSTAGCKLICLNGSKIWLLDYNYGYFWLYLIHGNSNKMFTFSRQKGKIPIGFGCVEFKINLKFENSNTHLSRYRMFIMRF